MIAASRLKRHYTPLSSDDLLSFTLSAIDKFRVNPDLRRGVISRVLAVQSIAQIHKRLHACIEFSWPLIGPCFKRVGFELLAIFTGVISAYSQVKCFKSKAIRDITSLLDKYWASLRDSVRLRGHEIRFAELRSSLNYFFFEGIPKIWNYLETVEGLVHARRKPLSVGDTANAMRVMHADLPYSSEILTIARIQKVNRSRDLEKTLRQCRLRPVISSTRQSMHADMMVETVRRQVTFFEKLRLDMLRDCEKVINPFIKQVPAIKSLLLERDAASSGMALLEVEVAELEDCYFKLCCNGLVCSVKETTCIHRKLEQFLRLLLKLQRQRMHAVDSVASVVLKLF